MALFPDHAGMASLSRYLINFLLDATVGMLLIYVGVRAVGVLVEWQQWESLRFGEYGNVQGHWVGPAGDSEVRRIWAVHCLLVWTQRSSL